MTRRSNLAWAAALAMGCVGCGGAKPRDEVPPAATAPGFSMMLPPGFTDQGAGVWEHVELEDGQTRTLRVTRLAAQPSGDAQTMLETLWREAVTSKPAYSKLGTPLPQRRLTHNGARAHFLRTRVFTSDDAVDRVISLYLVEAGAQFVPLLVSQEVIDHRRGSQLGSSYPWDRSHAPLEALFKHLSGSPAGVLLVDDVELEGHFITTTSNTLEWSNKSTGATSMTAVVSAVEYTFHADHTYEYQLSGASGVVGTMNTFTEEDRGQWRVERDVLVLDGERHDRRYLITGAGRGAKGEPLLLLQAEANWSLAPNQPSELFVRK